MNNLKSTKNKLKSAKSNTRLDKQDFISYFPHLRKDLTIDILHDEENYRILLNSLNEFKLCKENNQCTDSKYHEIPYIEKDIDGNPFIYLKRERCSSSLSFLNDAWKNFFLIDDYSKKIYADFSKAYIEIKKNRLIDSSELDKLVAKMYNKKTNNHNQLINKIIINQYINDFEVLIHEYAIKLAQNSFKIAYINLISFYSSFKNKFVNSTDFENYNNAFKKADIIFFTNLDVFPVDEIAWSYLFSVFNNLMKENKHIIIMSKISMGQIANNSLDKNKIQVYSIVVRTLEAVKNYISFSPV